MLGVRFGIFENDVSVSAGPSRHLERNRCYLS